MVKDFEMLTILLAGLITGFLMSAPLGPMAALAALEISRKQMRAAFAVALGVCVGDVILAAVSAGLLNIDVEAPLPEWFQVTAAAVLLLSIGVWIWKDADKPVNPAEGYKTLWSAIAVTLVNPGNVAAYLALYSAVLPRLGVKEMADLTGLETGELLVATTLGLALGWAAFLVGIMAAIKKFGTLPPRLWPLMARGVSALMIVAAIVLVGLYVKG